MIDPFLDDGRPGLRCWKRGRRFRRTILTRRTLRPKATATMSGMGAISGRAERWELPSGVRYQGRHLLASATDDRSVRRNPCVAIEHGIARARSGGWLRNGWDRNFRRRRGKRGLTSVAGCRLGRGRGPLGTAVGREEVLGWAIQRIADREQTADRRHDPAVLDRAQEAGADASRSGKAAQTPAALASSGLDEAPDLVDLGPAFRLAADPIVATLVLSHRSCLSPLVRHRARRRRLTFRGSFIIRDKQATRRNRLTLARLV